MPNSRSLPQMYIDRAKAVSMISDFVGSKLQCFKSEQVVDNSIFEFCTPRILELIIRKFKEAFPGQVGGVKAYFVCNPSFGEGIVSLLLTPTKPPQIDPVDKIEFFPDLDFYISLRLLMDQINPEQDFLKAKVQKTGAADVHAEKYRNTILPCLKGTVPDVTHSDTRSISYKLEDWEEFVAEVLFHQVPAIKIYFATDNKSRQLSLIYMMQRMVGTRLVDYFLEETPDFITRFDGTLVIKSFDTGNPCPPGSGLTQDRCPGSGLEP